MAVFISFVIILSVSILGALSVAIFVSVDNLQLQSGPLQVFETFFHEFGFEWALPVMAACVAIGAIGHIIVWIIGPTEALSVAAHDGVVPPFLQRRNSAGVPVAMLLVQGVVVTALSIVMGMININAGFAIVTLVSGMVYLVMYALMFISCLVLRYKHPNVERSYKIPGGWIGIWVLVTVGTITCIAGIILSCFPPEAKTEADFIDAVGDNWKMLWVIYTVPAFVIIIIVPFIIYAFRRPHWAPPEELLTHENIETSAHQKEVH
jgi:amino acid transporter